MKIIYLLSSIFLLILTGCYSTYNVSDFSSRDKFYEDFDKSVNDKAVKVTLMNDSSFTIDNGAIIIRDTLYALGFRTHKKFGSIAISKIKKIGYIASDYKSANLLLTNGEQIRVGDISIANDTMEYSVTKEILTRTKVALLDGIKEVNYKNHWLGIPSGFLIGAVSGIATTYIISLIIKKTVKDENIQTDDFYYSIITVPPLGSLIGTIWGWLNGYTYTYQFNP
ncbi:MAG: hypothetical protein ACYDEE_08930 [Ignavibacteriaceae bacterium]